MEINAKLDAALKALEGAMIDTLARWIRVPSVRAERSADNAPFGAQVRRALDVAMEDMARLGMNPRDVDGYCCDGEIGTGDEVIAVLAHLDVVPEGEGWHHDPYGAEIVDGRMVGRGTSDDKGPGVAALFAMKAIVDAGIPLRRRCRLILGCDEECGMQDLEYYEKKIGLPAKGFSPDADFPLINTEKFATRDKYAAFLDGNNGYSTIEGDGEGSILVIKDSYANSFVPYLTANYAKIGVVDLRNFSYGLDSTIEAEGYDEVLVLYNFQTFIADKRVVYIDRPTTLTGADE